MRKLIGLRVVPVLLFVVCAVVLPGIARADKLPAAPANPPQVTADASVDTSKIDLELWKSTHLKAWADQNFSAVDQLQVKFLPGQISQASCGVTYLNLYPFDRAVIDDHGYQVLTHEATHALTVCYTGLDSLTSEALAETARHLVTWQLKREHPELQNRNTDLFIADIINNLNPEVVAGMWHLGLMVNKQYRPGTGLMELLADRMKGHSLRPLWENLAANPILPYESATLELTAPRLDQVIEGKVNGVLPSTYFKQAITTFTTGSDGHLFSLMARGASTDMNPLALGNETSFPVNPFVLETWAYSRQDGQFAGFLDAWMNWEVTDAQGRSLVRRNSEIKNGSFFDTLIPGDDTSWPTDKGAYKLTGCILQGDGSCNADPNLRDTTFFIQWGQWFPRWYPPILEDWTEGRMFIIANGPSYQELGDKIWRKLELVDPHPKVRVERYPGLLVVNLNGSTQDVVVTDGEKTRAFTPHSWLSTIYLFSRRAQPHLKVVTNAATYGEEPLSPGGIYTAWTWGASHDDPHANEQDPETETLPSACLDTRVVLMASGKEYSAPIFYCDMYQVNFQVPYELDGTGEASVAIELKGARSNTLTVAVAPASPGIFIIAAGEPPIGAMLDISGRLVTADNPVRPGDAVSVYSTGLGAIRPHIETGKYMRAAAAELSVTTLPVGAELGGTTTCPVLYSGLAPGFVGLYQVNLMVPLETQEGSYRLSLMVDGKRSNEVLLPVAPR